MGKRYQTQGKDEKRQILHTNRNLDMSVQFHWASRL
jgi:hypothetical protein